MEKITILAPAKINLFLRVGDRRKDGYHDIETVMQTVTMFDRLEVCKNESEADAVIDVRCRDFTAPDGAGNIVFRAAAAFFRAAGIDKYDVSFAIDKKIPAEAGLGGGSSDAAAAIIALDRLYGTAMAVEDMCTIGAGVGADVPFCIKKGTASARGIGEIVESCAPMPDCAILVAIPDGSRIRTAEAYEKIDRLPQTAPCTCADMLSAMTSCDLERISSVLYNQFEAVTEASAGVSALIDAIKRIGALGVRMSGSGPAVFGLFRDIASARTAKDSLGDGISAFVCAPARRDYPYIES